MKNDSIKSLALNKKYVSNLTSKKILGGAEELSRTTVSSELCPNNQNNNESIRPTSV